MFKTFISRTGWAPISQVACRHCSSTPATPVILKPDADNGFTTVILNRDRFYKTSFWLKTFRIKCQPQILNKLPHKNYRYKLRTKVSLTIIFDFMVFYSHTHKVIIKNLNVGFICKFRPKRFHKIDSRPPVNSLGLNMMQEMISAIDQLVTGSLLDETSCLCPGLPDSTCVFIPKLQIWVYLRGTCNGKISCRTTYCRKTSCK
jgi:hypothetical protein